MEGLIPMVFKSIKKNRIRKQYKCLSSGATDKSQYNIADFYTNDYSYYSKQYEYGGLPEPEKISDFRADGGGGHHHRRNHSIHVDYSAASEDSVKSKQLVRFRSLRMFSCVTGA
ncbi:uncharacterized protein LOC111396708 [Olea europaea var. sylvestris]|uniref:Uncharacterized protein n=1 Tax=Olea europaea subsp. europaea TaxID=158383 RepID=A0A8S0PWX0_OLEEU|nr:uncharacterized protein LOC111396708 [Olea europaea var. sylvestris]CAA2957795.1 Hypothetical predicted protein [Olea europaea subsp. europaea]CAA2984957.1 Hypothetical predicted protein [Olea europaea subsp. europaea]